MKLSINELILFAIDALIIIVAGRDLIFSDNPIWHKRISKAGYILISLSILGLIFSVRKLNSDNKEKVTTKKESDRNRTSDSIIINALKTKSEKLQYSLDTMKNQNFNGFQKDINAIHSSANKMTNLLSKLNQITQNKVDNIGNTLKSADIELSKVSYNMGFNWNDKNDTTFISGWIDNIGNKIAYNVTYNVILAFGDMNLKMFQLKSQKSKYSVDCPFKVKNDEYNRTGHINIKAFILDKDIETILNRPEIKKDYLRFGFTITSCIVYIEGSYNEDKNSIQKKTFELGLFGNATFSQNRSMSFYPQSIENVHRFLNNCSQFN